MMTFNIQDTFNKELPADPIESNERRQVFEACYSFVTPKKPSHSKLIHYSKELAKSLGLTEEYMKSDEARKLLTGEEVLPGTHPYAMCYGGHQFGHWAGQLGDGRAINLFETVHEGSRWVLQLKGAGATPYSRTADGLAVLRSSIREHLCSEAMFHLGVPTTRSLSLALSGDQVMRDVMYDGNSAYEPGAIVCRVAPSFIRFGNFQIFTARRDVKTLREIADYTIKYYYPEVEIGTQSGYLEFFKQVVENTLTMIIHWQRVGFVHGVMNTDNMSILGLTIDYGPYGWMDDYNPNWTPNTTDKQERRYRFSQQPGVALWNLLQLANALFPLINDVKSLEAILEGYKKEYQLKYSKMMFGKLGIKILNENSLELIKGLENALTLVETDMTVFFRELANLKVEHRKENPISLIIKAFYKPEELTDSIKNKWNQWLDTYRNLLRKEGVADSERKKAMNAVNPKYVLRNYMAQLAIDAAERGDYSILDEIHQLMKKPYDEQSEFEKWYAKRPDWARDKIGCSMLSCSS